MPGGDLDLRAIASLMEAQASAIAALCRPLDPTLGDWRPADGGWSIRMVLAHLHDEEREDFRPRLAATLEDPLRPWPEIDPEAWAVERGYARRAAEASLDGFLAERRISLAWIGGLERAAWSNVHHHPSLPPLSARDLLAAWLDHDRLHLRQMLRLLHQAGAAVVPGAWPDYAGDW